MRKIIILVFLAFSLSFGQFNSNVSGVGTNAASFLEIGVSARATAMGGAYTSLANDATALYYNPAVMAWLSGNQVELSHIEWFVGTDFDMVSAVFPIGRSAIGLGYTTLGYGSQPIRTIGREEGNGLTWDARDFVVSFGYALAITDRFSFGGAVKYISQRIYDVEASTFAIDLGIQYITVVEGLQLGMSISNFGDEMKMSGRSLHSTVDPDEDNLNVDRVPVSYNTSSFPLPLLFRGGISYNYDFDESISTLVSMDVNHPSAGTEFVNIGLEVGFKGMFFLRGGYESLFEEDRNEAGILSLKGVPSYGFGLDYHFTDVFGIRIDYAHSEFGLLENTDRFSIGFAF
jgi:hypothetical protein